VWRKLLCAGPTCYHSVVSTLFGRRPTSQTLTEYVEISGLLAVSALMRSLNYTGVDSCQPAVSTYSRTAERTFENIERGRKGRRKTGTTTETGN